MIGKLTLVYFADGKLKQEEYGRISQEAAQELAARAVTDRLNVQITWTTENES